MIGSGDSVKFCCAEKEETGVQKEVRPEKLIWTRQALGILRCLKSTLRKKAAECFL